MSKEPQDSKAPQKNDDAERVYRPSDEVREAINRVTLDWKVAEVREAFSTLREFIDVEKKERLSGTDNDLIGKKAKVTVETPQASKRHARQSNALATLVADLSVIRT